MTIADLPEAAQLDSRAFADSWSIEGFNAELEKDYSGYFAAYENGIMTGYAGIWCIYETAELIRIASAPEYRRKGIGSALLNTAFCHAKNSGCERMLLEVRASNTAARAMYEKHGFRQTGIRRRYYDGTEDAVIMEINLKG